MLQSHMLCQCVGAGEGFVALWPGTDEGLLAGMRADVGYKGESRSLREPTTVARRPLASVVRLVHANVRGVDVFYETREVAEYNAAVVPEACHRI
jgi:hypothetical protein